LEPRGIWGRLAFLAVFGFESKARFPGVGQFVRRLLIHALRMQAGRMRCYRLI
jgi:hypothetical protein